jgi:hypothetical protein
MKEQDVFQFIVGWILLIGLLTLLNKWSVGHVLIYYSLLLIILLILVSQYAQITPYLTSLQSIEQFNAKFKA